MKWNAGVTKGGSKITTSRRRIRIHSPRPARRQTPQGGLDVISFRKSPLLPGRGHFERIWVTSWRSCRWPLPLTPLQSRAFRLPLPSTSPDSPSGFFVPGLAGSPRHRPPPSSSGGGWNDAESPVPPPTYPLTICAAGCSLRLPPFPPARVGRSLFGPRAPGCRWPGLVRNVSGGCAWEKLVVTDVCRCWRWETQCVGGWGAGIDGCLFFGSKRLKWLCQTWQSLSR